MQKLEQKQGPGAFLQEKLSFQGFSEKTEDLNVKTEKIQGLTREKARGGRRVQIWENSGV